MSRRLVLVESNTTGTGRLFARAAEELGLEPLLLADDPDRYPFAREDGIRTVRIDTGDVARLVDVCRSLDDQVSGVTSSSEYFIGKAAAVAAALGLAAPDPRAIEAARDKGHQHLVLERAGVATARYAVVTSADEAAAAARSLGPPVVVKPVAGSGSVGVVLCSSDDAAEAHAADLLAVEVNERGLPVPRRVVVERFVTGPEYSVEIVGRDVVGITRKHLGPPPRFVEIGHDFPAPLGARAAAKLERATLAALDALHLERTPAHVELRLENDEPVVIEVNPRLAGGFIPELVRRSRGIDVIRAVVARAAAAEASLAPTHDGAASIRFLVARAPGVVGGHDDAVRRALREEGVVEAAVYREPGAEVVPCGDFRDRLGHVIGHGSSVDESAAAAERGLRALADTLVQAPQAREAA